MEDIRDKVDEVLSGLFDYYYNSMPEFSEDEEPETYAVYSIHEKPENFASGKYLAKTFWISLSIFTTDTYDYMLYSSTETAFGNADFTYAAGSEVKDAETTEPYPRRCRYVQEYIKNMEVQ